MGQVGDFCVPELSLHFHFVNAQFCHQLLVGFLEDYCRFAVTHRQQLADYSKRKVMFSVHVDQHCMMVSIGVFDALEAYAICMCERTAISPHTFDVLTYRHVRFLTRFNYRQMHLAVFAVVAACCLQFVLTVQQ